MKTKSLSVRLFLPLLAAGLAFLTGCVTPQERIYALTQGADGKFYTPSGERRFPTAASVKVENTQNKSIGIFVREDRLVVIVPPHELRTIQVALDYYQEGYRLVLFARVMGETMQGKEFAKREFYFRNDRSDPVYGAGWGSPVPETKIWVIGAGDFILQQQPPVPFGRQGLIWFR